MAKINPFILQNLRWRKGWSQDRLAEMAAVNKQTISRIERGEPDNTRKNTINQLAHALGAEPVELTRETVAPENNQTERIKRRTQSDFGVSAAANNFLNLISQRYYIKPWQVMELAPLLFCWAAEMSLRERRERLSKLEETCATARAVENEMPHLPPANFIYSEKKIAAEGRSIDAHDIFGMCFGDDDFGVGQFNHVDDATENPFAVFLSKITEKIGGVARFEAFSPVDYPEFLVCPEEALAIVGGDETLAGRILTGAVDLYEMPKDLQGPLASAEGRAAWIQAESEAFIERQLEALWTEETA